MLEKLWLALITLTIAASCGSTPEESRPAITRQAQLTLTQRGTLYDLAAQLTRHTDPPTTEDGESDEETDMGRNTEELRVGYGQHRDFAANTFPVGGTDQPGPPQLVGRFEAVDAPPGAWQPSKVKTLILGFDFPANVGFAVPSLQWGIDFGLGGTREQLIFDALKLTQISLPAETGDIFVRVAPGASAPDMPVRCFFMAGDGSTPNAGFGAQLSVPFVAAIAPLVTTLTVPAGANRWRIQPNAGAAPGSDLFLATTLYTHRATAAGVTLAQDVGTDVRVIYNGAHWLPLLPGVNIIQVSVVAGPVPTGTMVWGLAL